MDPELHQGPAGPPRRWLSEQCPAVWVHSDHAGDGLQGAGSAGGALVDEESSQGLKGFVSDSFNWKMIYIILDYNDDGLKGLFLGFNGWYWVWMITKLLTSTRSAILTGTTAEDFMRSGNTLKGQVMVATRLKGFWWRSLYGLLGEVKVVVSTGASFGWKQLQDIQCSKGTLLVLVSTETIEAGLAWNEGGSEVDDDPKSSHGEGLYPISPLKTV